MLCPWWSRAGWHGARSQSLPGPVVCHRVLCRCCQGGACRQLGWQASVLGVLRWCPGSPPPLPRALPLAGDRPMGTPITPAANFPPQLQGTAAHESLMWEGVPASCLPPPQTLLPCTCSPPQDLLLPQAGSSAHSPHSGGQRLATAHIPTPWLCAPRCPPGCQGPHQPPSLPSPASLGMAPRARAV